MNDNFQFTVEQENFIKEKMGVSDINKITLIFEVDSVNTEGVTTSFTNDSTKLLIRLCPCGDGNFSWLCCP